MIRRFLYTNHDQLCDDRKSCCAVQIKIYGVSKADYNIQSMRNIVSRRSVSGKTCMWLVESLGSPVTMTRNICQMLFYI